MAWIKGFLSGQNPVIEKDGAAYVTREAAAEAGHKEYKGRTPILVVETGKPSPIYEATRNDDDTWSFITFPNLSRHFGD